jgi:trigger factor
MEQRQAALSITVSEDRIQQAFQQKLKSLAREVPIPGFRPGKAPASFVIKRFGAEAIRSEVIDEMMQTIMEEALKESKLDVYDVVRMEDFNLEPTSFKIILALPPTVDLGDYRAVRKEMPEIAISEEALNERLAHLREHHEVLEPVDRPSELGDVVMIGGKGWLTAVAETEESEEAANSDEDGREIIFNQESAKVLLDADKTYPGVPFVDNLVGRSVGDVAAFSFTFAEDYDDEHLRGREANFSLEILDVNQRELPELDDELAKLEGDFETLDELQASIRENMEAEATDEAEGNLFDAFLEELMESAELAYPPLMVEQEAEAFEEGIKKELEQAKLNWSQYLEMIGQEESALKEAWLAEAETRVKRHLILREFITLEKLTVTHEDMAELLHQRLSRYQDPEIRNYILSMYMQGDRGRELHNEALAAKVQTRVVAILTGQAPDLDALDEEE